MMPQIYAVAHGRRRTWTWTNGVYFHLRFKNHRETGVKLTGVPMAEVGMTVLKTCFPGEVKAPCNVDIQ